MSSPDMFLSSPLRASRRSVHVIPTSSPDLPSMQDMLSQKPKRPAIRSGSKAVPIPDDANSTFTSARELWKSAQSAEVNQLCVSAPSDRLILLDDNDTPKRTSDSASQAELLSRNPRRSETGIDASRPDVDQQDPEGALSQPWRKYKPRTPEKEPSPHVHASSEKNISKVASKHQGIEIGSRETTPSRDPPLPRAEEDTTWDPRGPLLLEPAMVRRKDWTPPTKNSVMKLDSDASATRQDVFGLDEDDSTKSFGNILSAYKCDEANAANESDGSTTKKRKLAPQRSESIAISTTSAKPVKKPRAPAKKARTITALATAAYRQPLQNEPTKGSQDATAPVHAKPLNETSKKAKPRKRPSKVKKKPEPPKPVLYSPETALKQVAKQDFVFGTSSQLAMEQSPTFVRGRQEAMKDSNQLDEIDFTTPLNSDAIEPPEARPRLWDAAARDADGDLFDVEVVNLTEASPQPPQTSADVDPYGYVKVDDIPGLPNNPQPVKSITKNDDFFLDISDILPKKNSSLGHAVGKGTNDSTGTDLDLQHVSKPVLDTMDAGPQTAREETTTIQNTNQQSRPLFEMYTDAQLSKEVSQYGFKPIKRRSAMIALLDQCWQQKGSGNQQQQIRLASTAATSPAKRPRGRPRKKSVDSSQLQEPPPSAQAPETPKRPRGRPRKDSQTTQSKQAMPKRNMTPPRQRKGKNKVIPKKAGKTSVIEIPDSESELAEPLTSSPNSSQSSTFSSPQNGDLTMSVTDDTELSLAITPTDSQSGLFTHITKAITSAPRTTDPSNPSWHEKILLYDPVVLEELTSWLNSGQLSRVGYDGETNPADLKKWCESKSICCLWKVNLRGKERKRY